MSLRTLTLSGSVPPSGITLFSAAIASCASSRLSNLKIIFFAKSIFYKYFSFNIEQELTTSIQYPITVDYC